MGRKHKETWGTDQLLKSKLFHSKLHSWRLVETAEDIKEIDGSKLNWNEKILREHLGISEKSWNKVIHKGIKPVVVFAHPEVLLQDARRIAYYRMLSMVSQKSMGQVGLSVNSYEEGKKRYDRITATHTATHLNMIISELIKSDKEINLEELILWRGMTAGSQAQGSWQNIKGKKAENSIRHMIADRLMNRKIIYSFRENKAKEYKEFILKDGRKVVFASEPDVGIYSSKNKTQVVVEIKGGIDPAGVLERLGASLKSLARAKRENKKSKTILILPVAAITDRFIDDVENADYIDEYFSAEEVLSDTEKQNSFFKLLNI